MGNTSFIIDGFNLYHSLRDLSQDRNGATTKWLNVPLLCKNYLSAIGDRLGNRAEMEKIYYFSARPTHKGKDTQKRHTLYMRCLRKSGVVVELSQFKRKDRFCRHCNNHFVMHEEKETDVALASKLFETCHEGKVEAVVLLTGDTDLAPAVRTCQQLFPEILLMFLFPYKRRNQELADLCPHSFSLKPGALLSHQFPDTKQFSDGTVEQKPSCW